MLPTLKNVPTLILPILVVAPTLTYSESSRAAEPVDTITVTATRLEKDLQSVPASISVVDEDDIQLAKQQLGLDESLAKVPGLFMMNRYNLAQDLRVSIRGFGARSSFGIRGIKILVDGIPETLPDGQGSVDSIDLGSSERIEVIRGPASSLYGNASGGAILVTSEQAPETPFVSYRPVVGDGGFKKHQLKFGGGGDKMDYFVSLSNLDYDGYREHSETEITNMNGRFGFAVSDDAELKVSLGYTDSPIANDPGGVNLEAFETDPQAARQRNVDFDSGEALEQTKLGLVYDRDVGDSGTLTARTYVVSRDFSNKLPFVGGGAVQFERALTGLGLQYTGDVTLGGKPNRYTVGVDYDVQDDDRQRFDNNEGVLGDQTLEQNEKVTSTGLFLQNEFSANDKTQLTAGVRFDSVKFDVTDTFLSDGDDSGDRTMDEVSTSLGVSYQVSNRTNLYASYATSFETPTTTEFANPTGGGFNSDLNPQTATNLEIGLKGSWNDKTTYEVALFKIDVEDELIPFELEDQPDREFFANAGESERIGLELSLTAKATDNLSASLAYTYSDFSFTDFVTDGGDNYNGNAIPGIPENQLHLQWDYQADNGAYGQLELQYVDEINANNANTTVTDNYMVANLRMGYTKYKDNWELSPFIGVNNITDEAYSGNIRINAFGGRHYEAAPERNIYGGLSVRYYYE